MSRIRLTFFLTLIIIGFSFSSFYYIHIILSLRNKVDRYKIENEKLKETIYELKKSIFQNKTIIIGVTASSDFDYNITKKFFEEIIEKEVNEYSEKLGYNIRFRFIVRNNEENCVKALENLEYFKERDINIVIGHPWSSHTYISMSYVEANNILLFSPSASSLQLKRIGDNLLRMCPDHTDQVKVIIEAIKSLNIKAIIILYEQSDYGINLYKVLMMQLNNSEINLINGIQINPFSNNVRSCLDEAEKAAKEAIEKYGYEHVAIIAIGSGSFINVMRYMENNNYSTINNLIWFGSHYMAKNQAFIDKIPDLVAKLKILSPLPAPSESPLYFSLNERYHALFSQPLNFEMACRYDIAFIIVKAILIAQTTKVEQLLQVIPEVAATTFGVSGLCRLDDAGDREITDYEIWGYRYINGSVISTLYGRYNGLTGRISWYMNPN